MAQNDFDSTTARPHVLCVSCKSFWQSATCLSFTVEELSRGGEGVPSMPQHLLHSQDRTEVVTAACLGCHFCSIVLGSVVGCTGNHADQGVFSTSGPLYISINILNRSLGTFLLTLFPCEQLQIDSHDLILNNYPLRLSPSTDPVTITVPNETQIPSLQTSTFSKATADFVKSWILQCQTNHPLCGEDPFNLLNGIDPPPRPKRLLDLLAFQDLEKIQLVETELVPNVDYCALSYSWGFSKPFSMTSLNLIDFQREIQLKDLPKTIGDAIQVVRGIGFRYLWIDALCIMQDGHSSPDASKDWFDQVNKLHDIFGNSVVTIAASESFDGDQGFIKPRNPLSQTTCRLQPETILCYEVIPPCTPHCLSHPFDSARYHLDTRAWVFQERILSPRSVHFTRNFVHLECRTELKCETRSGIDTCHHSGAVPKADYQTLFAFLGMTALGNSVTELFLSYWHEMMKRYSNTNLCRNEDLLVAVAGLATRIQKQSQLTWSFGLWREHILRDMLWYVRGGMGTPCRERAPSWSWASIEVRGPQILYEASAAPSLVAKIIALPEVSGFGPQTALTEHESRHKVKVVGLMKLGALGATNHTSNPNLELVHQSCQGIRHLHPQCPFHPDYELPENIELHSLLVARVSGARSGPRTLQSSDIEMGIVLTPVPGFQRRYRRVGYFHHMYNLEPENDLSVPRRLPSLFDQRAKAEEIEIV